MTMNIEEHNQRRPVVKRATLQQPHHSNTTMDDQSSDNTPTEQVTDQNTEDMGAQPTATNTDTVEDAETAERGARRPRDEEESQYENEHVRKKAMEYHDTKTEGAFFISTTYDMINRCNNQCPEIACWSPDGKTVLIRDQTAFAQKILPDYFTSKYESFTRQLSFYGFRKMQAKNHGKKGKKSQKCASFINDKFQRDKPDLLKFIKRTTNHGVNALKQSEEDKIYMEEQKKEVQELRDIVEEQKKEIHFLRIVQMEMKTQLAGVMQQIDMFKKESVLYAASMSQPTASNRSRRSYNMPPPLTQQQRAGNKTAETSVPIAVAQPPQIITMQAPAAMAHASNRTASTDSKMSTLLTAVDAVADKELNTKTIPQAATFAQFTATPIANTVWTLPTPHAHDLRANSFLRTLSGQPFPENWVLPGGMAPLDRDNIYTLQAQFVDQDPNAMAGMAQRVQVQTNKPEASAQNGSKELGRLELKENSTFGKNKKSIPSEQKK